MYSKRRGQEELSSAAGMRRERPARGGLGDGGSVRGAQLQQRRVVRLPAEVPDQQLHACRHAHGAAL